LGNHGEQLAKLIKVYTSTLPKNQRAGCRITKNVYICLIHMPAFKDVFIHKKLQSIEYEQLMSRGYLKLKIELSVEHLSLFQAEYKVGDKFIFHSQQETDLKTTITSIDTGEPHGTNYKVFIGFTLM
jgi:hypothetical protein